VHRRWHKPIYNYESTKNNHNLNYHFVLVPGSGQWQTMIFVPVVKQKKKIVPRRNLNA